MDNHIALGRRPTRALSPISRSYRPECAHISPSADEVPRRTFTWWGATDYESTRTRPRTAGNGRCGAPTLRQGLKRHQPQHEERLAHCATHLDSDDHARACRWSARAARRDGKRGEVPLRVLRGGHAHARRLHPTPVVPASDGAGTTLHCMNHVSTPGSSVASTGRTTAPHLPDERQCNVHTDDLNESCSVRSARFQRVSRATSLSLFR